MSLDKLEDIQTKALALVTSESINGELEELLEEQAVVQTFGAPIPMTLLGQNILPCLSVYRLRDLDMDKGDFIYQDLTTWHFDYYTPATPLNRIDRRWPLLRRVWNILLGTARIGRSPYSLEGKPLPELQNVLRYVLGSGRVDYGAASVGGIVYPSFRGQITFEVDARPPQEFYDRLQRHRLADFETLAVDWHLAPEQNSEIEAQSWITLDQI